MNNKTKNYKTTLSAYGATFEMHCPRCGHHEWSEEIYDGGKNIYHKCMHCGADVCCDGLTTIGIVVEKAFVTFTPKTYDDIKGEKGLKSIGWYVPPKQKENDDYGF
jgi:tRNA G26 N,N-dimethylase Trm1